MSCIWKLSIRNFCVSRNSCPCVSSWPMQQRGAAKKSGDKSKKPEVKKGKAAKKPELKKVLVQLDDEKCFMLEVLKKLDVPKRFSEMVVDSLIFADKRGILSHGLARFPFYVENIERHIFCCTASPHVLSQSEVTAWLDGHNGLGPVIGTKGMKMAIRKAKNCGLGLVSTKGSNHFGINSYYAMMAANEKLIGIVGTNASPLMVPPGGKTSVLGTNPVCIAVGTREGYRFCFDASVTKVSRGKIEMKHLEGSKMPKDWALDINGNATDNPEAALKADRILPSGEHKGFGLGIMVDILSGVLAGAKHSTLIRTRNSKEKIAKDLGHFFIAINPGMFVKNFEDRLMDFLDMVRSTEPMDENKPVLVPGDMEAYFEERLSQDGIPHLEVVVDAANKIAKRYKVEPLGFTAKN